MDHIEPPYGTKHLFTIPYMCNTRFTFDEGDLLTYPVRCGMVTPELLSSEKSLAGALTKILRDPELTLDDLAPFLQAWLYFGSLHFLFKTLIRADYQPNHFIREEPNGKVVVTTKYLFEYLLCWAAFESTVPENVDFGLAKVTLLLHIILDTVTSLGRQNNPFDHCNGQILEKNSSGHLVLLSILMLFEVLHQAAELIYGDSVDPFPGPLPAASAILKGNLVSAGWCPLEIGMLEHMAEISSTAAYFLSMIDRKSLQKDHSRCVSVTKCTAYDVNYDTYETKHVHPGCSCTFLPPIHSSVLLSISWIWDAGGIPLLTFHKEDGDKASLKVTYCPKNNNIKIPRYAAISHVWSDGIGNQEENSLPVCVLERIQERVNKLFESALWPVPFWIDTICVPKSNKLPALEGMLETYQKADIVLVLDASLEATTAYARPQEKLLRIAISPWMQRLWTLQEAWVTLNLAFQFQEAACSAMGLVEECVCMPNYLKFDLEEFETRKKMTTSPLPKFANRIARAFGVDYRFDNTGPFDWWPEEFLQTKELFKQKLEAAIPGYPENSDIRLAQFMGRSHLLDLTFDHKASSLTKLIQSPWRRRLSMSESLTELFKALRRRTTSRKEDEFYCLANLSNVPVAPILSARPEDRMEKLLSSMNMVPSSIIFSMGVPRLKGDHFTWAPIGFMEMGPGYYVDAPGLARIQDKELHVVLPGLKIKRPLSDNNPPSALAQLSRSKEPMGASTNKREYSEAIKLLFSDPLDHWVYRLMLPADNDSQETWETYGRFDLGVILSSSFEPPQEHLADGTVVVGVLVSQIEADSKIARVKYLETVYMARSSWEKTKPSSGGRYYDGEWVEEGHLWCIV